MSDDDDLLRLDAEFFRHGTEVWIEAECGIVMVPPNCPQRAQIPDEALADDPELPEFVTALRAGSAGPRLAVTVDDDAKTASAAGIAIDYNGYRMVMSFWQGMPVHWHVRRDRMRVLWQGTAIAEVPCLNGTNAFHGMMAEVDGVLWMLNPEFCIMVDDMRPRLDKAAWKTVVRDGQPIDVTRGVLARPLGPPHEPRRDDAAKVVWIGPARLQALYFDMVAHRCKEATWHATGPGDPVVAALAEERIAVVMPCPFHVKGGQA